jgi:aminoglycoside/choline kinase family phosphotransferase
MSAHDGAGTAWEVRRAWPYKAPGDYVLEVFTPGRPGVRGARLRQGHFNLIPLDDPKLPALRAEAEQGELITYRPYDRAVVRAEGRYIKIFRPGRAAVAAERCAQLGVLLDAGTLATPRVLAQRPHDVVDFSAIPGPTLFDIDSTPDDESFAAAWEKWSRAWVTQVGGTGGPASRNVLASLPIHSAELEARKVWRSVDLWLQHNQNNPALSHRRDAIRAAAEHVAANLQRTTPDPLVWAHGSLHDKQIIVTGGQSPLGLLDFDGTARAEAALDLASMDVFLELRLRENRMTLERYRTAHAQVLAAAHELQVSPDRFRAYSDARWLRFASMPLRGRFSLVLAVLDERRLRGA